MTFHAQKTDVAIIGAGPVGLFGVFACGMLGLKCHVVDALADIGGQCTALYPDKPIYDIPGFPSLSAAELIARLEDQARPFTPAYHLNQAATALIQRNDGRFTLKTAAGTEIDAGAVLIAGGAGAFGPNRPPIDNLAAFEGTSVFYAVRDPQKFAGKNVVIAGGGDSAIDWANILGNIADHVYLVHRRDAFRAAPESLRQLDTHVAAGRVTKVTPYQLGALTGANGTVKTVTVHDLDGNTRDLTADALLCFYGLSTSLGPLANFGLSLDGDHIVTDPTTAATNVVGIFAAGDMATYPHKLKLILTGFAEITQAAHSIYAHLNPNKPLHFVHSTTKGIQTP